VIQSSVHSDLAVNLLVEVLKLVRNLSDLGSHWISTAVCVLLISRHVVVIITNSLYRDGAASLWSYTDMYETWWPHRTGCVLHGNGKCSKMQNWLTF